METENFKLETLKMAERILNNNYNNSVSKCQHMGGQIWPTQPTTDDIVSLAQKLTDFIF